MSADTLKILENALKLKPDERASLAAELLRSLDAETVFELSEEWDAEIARRIEEVDSGKTATVPWPEARRQIIEGVSGQADG